MEFNKPVSNPMLIGAIELMKADDTQAHRGMFVNEVVKSEFLAPVVISPAPKPDENGRLVIEKGSNVQFPSLSAPDGRQFLMAFTDKMEFEKWRPGEEKYSFTLTFNDYVSMLLRKDKDGKTGPAIGVVINPYGCNLILHRDMIANIVVAKMRTDS